jgi:hypothetical protein
VPADCLWPAARRRLLDCRRHLPVSSCAALPQGWQPPLDPEEKARLEEEAKEEEERRKQEEYDKMVAQVGRGGCRGPPSWPACR